MWWYFCRNCSGYVKRLWKWWLIWRICNLILYNLMVFGENSYFFIEYFCVFICFVFKFYCINYFIVFLIVIICIYNVMEVWVKFIYWVFLILYCRVYNSLIWKFDDVFDKDIISVVFYVGIWGSCKFLFFILDVWKILCIIYGLCEIE